MRPVSWAGVIALIVMVQAILAALTDVVIFTWFSLRAVDPGDQDARRLIARGVARSSLDASLER